MTGTALLLGIDVGTGSSKAVICNVDGREVATASAPHSVRNPRRGWAEIDPTCWWHSVIQAVRTAGASVASAGYDMRSLRGIGLSGQMHGAVVVDHLGRPVRPAILLPDERATAVMNRYHELDRRRLDALGNPIVAGMTGPILCWLDQFESATLDQARWVLQCKDWIRFRLTGAIGAEHSDASATLLYDLSGQRWDDAVCTGLGVRRELLPPLHSSTECAGTLCPAAADELGIAPGVPVAYGAADAAAGLLGSGLTAPGAVQLTVGTGAQLATVRDAPNADPERRYHVFCDATGGYYALAAVQAAGLAFEWAWNVLGIAWSEAYTELALSPVGARGASFVPHLAGARSPSMDASATGAFCGLRLHNNRSDFVRAVFEGVAFSFLEAASALPEYADASEIRLVGGGSREDAWSQLVADVLRRPLQPLDTVNASAIGAAITARAAAGVPGLPRRDDVRAAVSTTRRFYPRVTYNAALTESYRRWVNYAHTAYGAQLIASRD